jgi:hypothetical protein
LESAVNNELHLTIRKATLHRYVVPLVIQHRIDATDGAIRSHVTSDAKDDKSASHRDSVLPALIEAIAIYDSISVDPVCICSTYNRVRIVLGGRALEPKLDGEIL